MHKHWTRKEITTRGADPTVVVTWSYREGNIRLSLTELQGVVVAEHNSATSLDQEVVDFLARNAYEQLENDWQEAQIDIDEADPFGGHDPFYGHA